MADLIERDAIEEVAHNVFEEEDALYYYNALHSIAKIVQAICEAPAVDAEPVRHGRWIYDRMDVVCSHCKTSFKDNIDFIQQDGKGRFVTAKRCPECGAKMDAKEA